MCRSESSGSSFVLIRSEEKTKGIGGPENGMSMLDSADRFEDSVRPAASVQRPCVCQSTEWYSQIRYVSKRLCIDASPPVISAIGQFRSDGPIRSRRIGSP